MHETKTQSHEVKLRIPFHDLDPMGVVWHGNYLKYFDYARAELYYFLGVDIYTFDHDMEYIFPITKTSIKYIHPLRHRDLIVCKASVREADIKIVVDFEIRKEETNEVCTRGSSDQVAIKLPENELMLRIPEYIRTGLGF